MNKDDLRRAANSQRIQRMSKRRRKIALLRLIEKEMRQRLHFAVGMPMNARTRLLVGDAVTTFLNEICETPRVEVQRITADSVICTVTLPDGCIVMATPVVVDDFEC